MVVVLHNGSAVELRGPTASRPFWNCISAARASVRPPTNCCTARPTPADIWLRPSRSVCRTTPAICTFRAMTSVLLWRGCLCRLPLLRYQAGPCPLCVRSRLVLHRVRLQQFAAFRARIAGWPDCHRQCGCDQHRQGGRARGRPAYIRDKTAHRSVPAKSCAALPRYCWNRASARR